MNIIKTDIPKWDDIALIENRKTTLISTGMGVDSTRGVPRRLLSYLTSVIAILEMKSEVAWQIYIADKWAQRLWSDSSVIERNTDQMRYVISQFVDNVKPDLSPRLYIDTEKSDNSLITSKRAMFIEDLVASIIEDPGSEKIRSFANKRSGGCINKSISYMVEHVLYMRDPVTKDPDLYLIDDPIGFVKQRVMVWWPAERIFCDIRSTIMDLLNIDCEDRNDQILTSIWRLPPYYRKNWEAIFWDELAEKDVMKYLNSVDRKLLWDTIAMLVMFSWSNHYEPYRNRKKLSQDDVRILKLGYQVFRDFIYTI